MRPIEMDLVKPINQDAKFYAPFIVFHATFCFVLEAATRKKKCLVGRLLLGILLLNDPVFCLLKENRVIVPYEIHEGGPGKNSYMYHKDPKF